MGFEIFTDGNFLLGTVQYWKMWFFSRLGEGELHFPISLLVCVGGWDSIEDYLVAQHLRLHPNFGGSSSDSGELSRTLRQEV